MWRFTLAWKNLSRRPVRSLLTILGLAIAVATVVSLVGISGGFERSYSELYARQGVDLVVQRAGGEEKLISGLDIGIGDKIRELPGVRRVVGGMVDVISFPEANLYTVFLQGWNTDSPLYEGLTFTSGGRVQMNDPQGVVLGRILAENLDKKVGDTLDIYDRPFHVVGIYTATNVYENSYAVISLNQLQKLTDRPHQVTGFLVSVKDRSDTKATTALQRKIDALGDVKAFRATEFIEDLQQIRLARGAAWLTSTIALTIGVIGVLNTMIMSAMERRREIGTLRAIGWHKGRVARMVLLESTMLSFAGATVGTISGVVLARVVSKLPIAASLIAGDVPPSVIAQGFLLALVVGVLGAIYPAIWLANLVPVEAMRRK